MDLRTFSRMDQAELQRADLHEEIDTTVDMMEPRLKNKIEVKREYGELPQVRCYIGHLRSVCWSGTHRSRDALHEEPGNWTWNSPSADGRWRRSRKVKSVSV